MTASPPESLVRAALVTCMSAEQSAVQKRTSKIHSLILKMGFLKMGFLGMAFLFAPAILPAFTLQWLEYTKTSYRHGLFWHFLLLLDTRGQMHVCIMTYTHSTSKQVLSWHYEDYKSGRHRAACPNRDAERAAECPEAGRPAGRQAENEITHPQISYSEI